MYRYSNGQISLADFKQPVGMNLKERLVYSKQPDWNPNKLPRTAEMDERYKNPDNDVRPWKSSDAFAPDSVGHQGMVYGVQHPITGKIMYPPNGRHWSFGQEQVLEIMQGWAPYELRDINDAEVRAELCGIAKESVRQDVKAIMLSVPLEEAAKQAEQVYQRGQWPVFCFSNNGKGGIRRKTYLTEVGGRLPTNFWAFTETGHTDEAKKEMLAIFDGKATFDTPKPHRLIEFVLKIAGSDNALVLDSFAGSGTTAHAVLNMNKADGGHRKFILIEMMDYADSITAERVKRVIHGYGEGKNAVEGTGGNFSFYDLGEPLLVGDCLNEAVAPEKIREYIWFMETKTPYAPLSSGNPYYLGKHNSTGYYFYYEPQHVTVLDYAFLATIKEKADGTVIYADRCSIGEDKLAQMGITFKKIPRDISRL